MRTITLARTRESLPTVGMGIVSLQIRMGSILALEASRIMAVVVAKALKNHDLGFEGVGSPARAAANLYIV